VLPAARPTTVVTKLSLWIDRPTALASEHPASPASAAVQPSDSAHQRLYTRTDGESAAAMGLYLHRLSIQF